MKFIVLGFKCTYTHKKKFLHHIELQKSDSKRRLYLSNYIHLYKSGDIKYVLTCQYVFGARHL